jgi:hypothetical protein
MIVVTKPTWQHVGKRHNTKCAIKALFSSKLILEKTERVLVHAQGIYYDAPIVTPI